MAKMFVYCQVVIGKRFVDMFENFKLEVFVGSLVNAFVLITVMKNLLTVKHISRNRFILSVLGLGIYIFLSYVITNSFIRMIILFLIIILSGYFCFKNCGVNLQKIIIYSFLEFTILLLSEMLGFIFIGLVGQTVNSHNLDNFLGKIMINMIVIFVFTLIMYIYILIRKRFKNNLNLPIFKNKFLLIYTLLSVFLFCIIFYISFRAENRMLIFVVNFVAIVVYSIIVFQLFAEKDKANKIQIEYDILSENLSEYENLLDMQRVSNHENKNQLLVIKGMADKNEKNISDYISSIIDTQYADNDLLIMKTNRIPSGGLRGLVYYKMLTMKDKKISVELDVDRSLRSVDFSNIPVKTNQELCKIVGVFLDNAIQEVEKLKVKKIDIVLNYSEDEVTIKISNNYDGTIDIDKISDKGYTTKGKGHGYGLSLVKQIVDENNHFTHKTEVNGKLFSQIIKLNLK